MQKLSLCVLFVLALVQDSAPADLLTLCSPDEPDERLGNNTVSVKNDQRFFCIPTDVAMLRKVDDTDTYDLSPRKTFYADISDVYEDGAAVTLNGTLDVGVLRNSCVFHTEEDSKTFVKFFMDESTVMGLENQLFNLIVGETRKLFQFYPTGLNLAGRRPVPTIYTTDQLPIRYISVFVLDDENTTRSIKSANSICKVNGDQFTTQGTLFFERRATGEDNCSTFHYTDQTLIVEGCLTLTNNDKKVNEDFGDRGTIEVAAVPGDCNNTELLALATRITISRPAPTTSTTVPPTPSPGPTMRTNSGGGGLNRGEIAGVIISSLIGVGIVVAVPLAVFCFIKWLKKPPPAPEANELSEMAPPDLEVVVEQDTDTKRPYVWCLWPDGDELEELLPNGTPGTIPESAKNDSHQLTALIMKDHCQVFYLIRHVSREELHKTNTAAWELLRDFNVRSFPPEILQKFIDVWVFDRHEGEGIMEVVPGPILTVNVSLKKWQGKMKECAEWIRSKARVNCDTPDGQFVSSQTPSATESPPRFNVVAELTGSEPIESTVDSPLPAVQTVKTPGLQTHQPQLTDNQNRPPQPFSPSSKQQVPHPSQEQPPPPYSNPNPDPKSNVLLTGILSELQKLNKKEDKLVAASERTANNTEHMRDAQEDTLALAEEMHEKVTEPREDAQEGT